MDTPIIQNRYKDALIVQNIYRDALGEIVGFSCMGAHMSPITISLASKFLR